MILKKELIEQIKELKKELSQQKNKYNQVTENYDFKLREKNIEIKEFALKLREHQNVIKEYKRQLKEKEAVRILDSLIGKKIFCAYKQYMGYEVIAKKANDIINKLSSKISLDERHLNNIVYDNLDTRSCLGILEEINGSLISVRVSHKNKDYRYIIDISTIISIKEYFLE